MKVALIVPAYKPTKDMLPMLERFVKETDFVPVVVDDGSGSAYNDIFEKTAAYAHVLRYETNRGKGGALKYGMNHILSSGEYASFTSVVTADADGQHKPDDIKRTASAIEENGGLVLGVRHFTGKVPFRSRFGNSMTKIVFALASGKKLTDTQTGLRGMRISDLPLHTSVPGEKYEYEMNVLFAAVKSGTEITEIPIETVYENNNESSHFHPIRDSYRIYKSIFLSRSMVKKLDIPKGSIK